MYKTSNDQAAQVRPGPSSLVFVLSCLLVLSCRFRFFFSVCPILDPEFMFLFQGRDRQSDT